MFQNKYGYFQGTEDRKKTKYKVEKIPSAQSRFKEPFFENYDLYETEGINGPTKHGPGGGFYQNMNEYKSVSQFIKKKKNKKNIKKARMQRRMVLLKNAIDFAIDDQINSTPILGDSGTFSDSIPFGGYLDQYLPENDFEGKSPDQLNFGRDYANESPESEIIEDGGELPVSETSLYGLPDGIIPEELDAEKTLSPRHLDYGTTNSGNTLYNNI